MVVVYGAWGYQIEWLGVEKMKNWWKKILYYLDDLNVIYCLTGEIDLWIGKEEILLPSKSTDELLRNKLPFIANNKVQKIASLVSTPWNSMKISRIDRLAKWIEVLKMLLKKTKAPIIIHPSSNKNAFELIREKNLLSANTIQTGHSSGSRNLLWQGPVKHYEMYNEPFINLEPWYEGIRDKFYTNEQLYAFWVTKLAGASSYCYGAHGIWNGGDGAFLSHWGKRTFDEALNSKSPKLLGTSNACLYQIIIPEGKTFYRWNGNELYTIGISSESSFVQYFPEIGKADNIPDGKYFLPTEGKFVKSLPQEGQVVVFRY